MPRIAAVQLPLRPTKMKQDLALVPPCLHLLEFTTNACRIYYKCRFETFLHCTFPSWQIRISCQDHCFKVAVNEQDQFEYKHRVQNLQQIDTLEITGDVTVTDVQIWSLQGSKLWASPCLLQWAKSAACLLQWATGYRIYQIICNQVDLPCTKGFGKCYQPIFFAFFNISLYFLPYLIMGPSLLFRKDW